MNPTTTPTEHDVFLMLNELAGNFGPRNPVLRSTWSRISAPGVTYEQITRIAAELNHDLGVHWNSTHLVINQLRDIAELAGKPWPFIPGTLSPWIIGGSTGPEVRIYRVTGLDEHGREINERATFVSSGNFGARIVFGLDMQLRSARLQTPDVINPDAELRGHASSVQLTLDEMQLQMPAFFAECAEIARNLNP